jgi:hypothetical protein
MCTLSLITRENGYLLGMNRDERIARGSGLPPEVREFPGTRAIYPSDGDGGTWLATNEYAVALALLNWNDVPSQASNAKKTRSRGLLIPLLVGFPTLPAVQAGLADVNIGGMLPFRLVVVFPSERKIGEWRWDSVQLAFLLHRWERRHWFSSSLSDNQAESLRGATCRDAWNQADAGSVPWLRRLHASHNDAAGSFSLCVHRPEVRTLSYSEIECTPEMIRMKHFSGSPCLAREDTAVTADRDHRFPLQAHVSGAVPTN